MAVTDTAMVMAVMDMAATDTEPRTTELVSDTALATAASATEGLATEGFATEGLATEGLATEGLATEGLATTATTHVRIPAITLRTQPTEQPTSLRVGFCIDDLTRVAVARKIRHADEYPTGSTNSDWLEVQTR